MPEYVVLWTILFHCIQCYSQPGITAATWEHIDTCISKKKNLSVISDLLHQIRQDAMIEKNYTHVARTYYYQILIADQRTEDSLFFRNSASIDSILDAD